MLQEAFFPDNSENCSLIDINKPPYSMKYFNDEKIILNLTPLTKIVV